MLIQLEKLNIVNEGYKRSISISKIYVNPTHVVSIKEYAGARKFLISEGATEYADRNFCLVKMSHGDTTEEIIALGTSEEVFESVNGQLRPSDRKLLNG
tara:strand:- start:337 stop:633 length:297 start_codon:yes stop_codon:yes gene_type:complete